MKLYKKFNYFSMYASRDGGLFFNSQDLNYVCENACCDTSLNL